MKKARTRQALAKIPSVRSALDREVLKAGTDWWIEAYDEEKVWVIWVEYKRSKLQLREAGIEFVEE